MVAEEFSLPVFDFTLPPEAFMKACTQFRGCASLNLNSAKLEYWAGVERLKTLPACTGALTLQV